MKRKIWVLLAGVSLICLCSASLLAAVNGWPLLRRQPPAIANQTLFSGVVYTREVRSSPRPLVVHIATVDLRQPGVRLLVTPGDPDGERSLRAQTTSAFLERHRLQLAVNGDGFTPWYSTSLLRYYPHAGDPVDPLGFAASEGEMYAQGNGVAPTLYISRNNRARFNQPIGAVYNAISGNLMLVAAGKPVPEALQAEAAEVLQPRTALALDKSGRKLIIVVVDGRQPGYSEGATLAELAEIVIAHGGFYAMNMDGGGSSTLVMADKNGKARLLNSPIDQNIPGRERPVGNHLGVYAAPASD